jgi:hypothetical protein
MPARLTFIPVGTESHRWEPRELEPVTQEQGIQCVGYLGKIAADDEDDSIVERFVTLTCAEDDLTSILEWKNVKGENQEKVLAAGEPYYALFRFNLPHAGESGTLRVQHNGPDTKDRARNEEFEDGDPPPLVGHAEVPVGA